MHYLAICAIFRDEARYLAEWITHYELQGVEHFYLYDDQSRDAPERILRPWIDRGVVTLYRVPNGEQKRQRYAYQHCLKTYRNSARWIGFVDIDEFAFVRNRPEPLVELMPRFERFPALGINWVCYGTSGFDYPPSSLVTTSYQLRGWMYFRTSEPNFLKDGHVGDSIDSYYPYNAHIKSFVNPNEVERMLSPHSFAYRNSRPAVTPGGNPIVDTKFTAFSNKIESNVLRINHYWSKSRSEFQTKLSRRRADNNEHYGEYVAFIRESGMNMEYDPSILVHSKAIAERLGLQFEPGNEAAWNEREAFQKSRDLNAEAAAFRAELKAAGRF